MRDCEGNVKMLRCSKSTGMFKPIAVLFLKSSKAQIYPQDEGAGRIQGCSANPPSLRLFLSTVPFSRKITPSSRLESNTKHVWDVFRKAYVDSMAGADFLVTKPGCSTKSGCITPTSNTQRSCRGNHSDSPSMRVQVRKNSSYERLGKPVYTVFVAKLQEAFFWASSPSCLAEWSQLSSNASSRPFCHWRSSSPTWMYEALQPQKWHVWLWVQKLGPPFINGLDLGPLQDHGTIGAWNGPYNARPTKFAETCHCAAIYRGLFQAGFDAWNTEAKFM